MGIVLRSAVIAGLVCALGLSSTTFAALARRSGGSGYSGTLSRNATIRQQQLAADPAAAATTQPSADQAPVQGTTSTTYNPTIVSLVNVIAGPTYSINGGVVAVQGSEGPELQDISSFLSTPDGPQLGYTQISYSSQSIGFASLVATGPGQITPDPGFVTTGHSGVTGFDTHALFFQYLAGVPNNTVASYSVFAAHQNQFFGNDADFMQGLDENGLFELGPDDLTSASVRGSLESPAIPLPPAAWTGLGSLGALLLDWKRIVRTITSAA